MDTGRAGVKTCRGWGKHQAQRRSAISSWVTVARVSSCMIVARCCQIAAIEGRQVLGQAAAALAAANGPVGRVEVGMVGSRLGQGQVVPR